MTTECNFGPSGQLPPEVLGQLTAQLPAWYQQGISIDDMQALLSELKSYLCSLLSISNDYEVLLFNGGAREQFAMVPMNFLSGQPAVTADYIITGCWSKLAYEDACQIGRVNIAATAEHNDFTMIPERNTWRLDPNAAYLHYTDDETVHGLAHAGVPECGDSILIADMTSSFLSGPLEVDKFGVVYASAQKNLGLAGGLTIVILRKDIGKMSLPGTPPLYDYQQQILANSMLNTPPALSWYVAKLMLQWTIKQGGLAKLHSRTVASAEQLYACIDSSDFYINAVAKPCRSLNNIVFFLRDPGLEPEFLTKAQERGLRQLAGHPAVGGICVHLSNVTPSPAVAALVEFMGEFAASV